MLFESPMPFCRSYIFALYHLFSNKELTIYDYGVTAEELERYWGTMLIEMQKEEYLRLYSFDSRWAMVASLLYYRGHKWLAMRYLDRKVKEELFRMDNKNSLNGF